MKHFYTLITLIFLFADKSFAQVNYTENFIKISKSYLEFRLNNTKGNLNKDKDMLMIGAKSINKNSLWFEISFVSKYDFSNFVYSKLYQLDSFKLLIIENLDKSNILKKLFREIPYENINKATVHIMAENSPWHVTLDKNYKIVSIESKYPIKDVKQILIKNKAKFSKNFKLVKAFPND